MKYASVFMALGLLLVFTGITGSVTLGWRIAAGWSGLAFLIAGLAYLLYWPWVFGKRSDGTQRGISIFLLLPYLSLIWLVWWLERRFSDNPSYHEIDGLILGRRLTSGEVDFEPRLICDLTSEFPECARLRSLPGYRLVPILDARAPDPGWLRDQAEELASSEGPVFIHCAQGHGRTGMMAALILMLRERELGAEDAVARLKKVRPGIGLSTVQWMTLRAAASLGDAGARNET